MSLLQRLKNHFKKSDKAEKIKEKKTRYEIIE